MHLRLFISLALLFTSILAAAQDADVSPATDANVSPAQELEALPAKEVEAVTPQEAEALPAKEVEAATPQEAEALPVREEEAGPAEKLEAPPVQDREAAPVQELQVAPAQKAESPPTQEAADSPAQAEEVSRDQIAEAPTVLEAEDSPEQDAETSPVLEAEAALAQETEPAPAQEVEAVSPQLAEVSLGLDPGLQQLAAEFFEWRRVQQPVSGDDIPRVERPLGWVPAFSAEDLAIYRFRYREFLERLEALDRSGFSRADEVDALALRAAVSRVGWELDVLNAPQRNPWFYLDQTLGSVFELLVLASPMTPERLDEIILRLNHFPTLVLNAQFNLAHAVQPFAEATLDALGGIEEKLAAVQAGLAPLVSADQETALSKAFEVATAALLNYRRWLSRELEDMDTEFSIGPRAYQWFLTNVALIPHTPEELLAKGRQAWDRAVAWDMLEENRDRDLPPLPVFESTQAQIEASARSEQEIRAFLVNQGLLTVPDWLRHYLNLPLPDYLQPLAFMGVTDDLTSEHRLNEDAYSYIPEPSAELPFFYRASAMDPRPLILHEGVPGHYFQLALSWANPDPIRRRYIDSGSNEGIGFYVEEMLLQAGLFAFSPRSREIIYRFMRLRALRVEVDIRLATGDFSIEEAADYLARTVPMDHETAVGEAVFFAFTPGQAISYQIGKLQILQFLADARLDRDEGFSLRGFHDYLMRNGNLPISLQRWEYLDRDDGIRRLQALQNQPVTVPD